jgi:hypothetical protein
VLLDGIKNMVFSTHSVLMCFMCGPTGLLIHIATKALFAKGAARRLVA